MVDFLTPLWMGRNIILTNALSCATPLCGNPALTAQIESLKEQALNEKDRALIGKPFRRRLTHKLLAGHIREFQPDLSSQKEELKAFGIKRELYRPLQSIIGALGLCYEVPCGTTLETIQTLKTLKVLSDQGAKNLTLAVKSLLLLRLQAHHFYGEENEFLFHQEGFLDPKKLYLNDERIKYLQEIYQVLIPLHKCAQQFLTIDRREAFFQHNLRDEGPMVQGRLLEDTFQYKKAQEAYQQAVSLNPHDSEALLVLGRIENDLGDPIKMLQRSLKALEIAKNTTQELNDHLAGCYNNVGIAYRHKKNYSLALENEKKALEIWEKLEGQEAEVVGLCHDNLGIVYESLGNLNQARFHLNKALTIRKRIFGENNHEVAKTLNNLVNVYKKENKFAEALSLQLHSLRLIWPI